jgi:hypothetical protein
MQDRDVDGFRGSHEIYGGLQLIRRVLGFGILAAFAAALFAHPSTSFAADNTECMSAASKGQELRDQGKLIEARGHFQQCAQTTCPMPIPKYCSEWLAELSKKMPTVVVRAVDDRDRDVTDATMSIDDGPTTAVDGRPLDLDPGKHKLKVSSGQRSPYETEIVVAQSEKDRVVVARLTPPKPPESNTNNANNNDSTKKKKDGSSSSSKVPLISWIGWGIGAVGLISFTAFGIKARSDYNDFESTCGTRCTIDNRDTVSTSVTIADVSLVIGLVAAGVGTAFYIFQPKTTPAASAASIGGR